MNMVKRKRIDLDDELTKEIDYIVERFKNLGVRNASRTTVLNTLIDNFDPSCFERKQRSKKIIFKRQKKEII